MGQQDAGNLGELFASAGLEVGTAGIEEHVGHIDDEAASGIAGLQDGVELLQKLRAELSLFGFGFGGGIASLCGLGFGSGAGLGGLLSLSFGGLLLGKRGLARGFRFLLLLGSLLRSSFRFLLHSLGFGLGLLGGEAVLLGLLAALRFGSSLGARLSFALLGGSHFGGDASLSVFLSLGLYGHNARFLGGFNGVAGSGVDDFAIAVLAVGVFGGLKLLLCLGKSGAGVFIGIGVAGDAYGVAGFEKFERRISVDAEDGVVDLGVGGGVRARADQFIGSVNILGAGPRRDGIFQHDHVARLRNGVIRLGGDNHAEGLHRGVGLDFGFAIFQDDFAEVFGAAFGRNSPKDVGEVLQAEFGGLIEARKFNADIHAVIF